MNTSVCMSLIVVLVILIIYEFLVSKTSLSSTYVNYFSVFLMFVIIIYSLLTESYMEKYENVVGSQTPMTFEDFIKKFNIKDDSELSAILTARYNEDLTDIYNNNMTLYYSIFSVNSYKLPSEKLWYNISPFFETHVMKDCPTRNQMNLTHINNGNVDIDMIGRFNGVPINNTTLEGPLSYQMGFEPRGFSVFLLYKFETLTYGQEKDFTNIFHIFGNTLYNNAVDLAIVNNSIRFDQKETYTLKFALRYSSDEIIISQDVEVNINNVHLLSFVKDSLNIYVYLNDMNRNTEVEIFKHVLNGEKHKFDLLLSNKKFVINENKKFNCNIFAISVFNQPIIDRLKVIKYFSNELYKISDEFKRLAMVFLSAQMAVKKLSQCPYSKETCEICGSVKDWTDMDITKLNKECLSAINKNCSLDPSIRNCDCWEKSQKTNDYCTKYRSIFDSNIDLCPKKEDVIIPPTIVKDTRCDDYLKCINGIIKPLDWSVDNENIKVFENYKSDRV